jgi:hypothetical protein
MLVFIDESGDPGFKLKKGSTPKKCSVRRLNISGISGEGAAPLPYPWDPMERAPSSDNSGSGGDFASQQMISVT